MHKLTYLRRLTDDFGVWQHTQGEDIDKAMGYALDDAARALIVYLDYGDKKHAEICLDYLARSQSAGKFIGFFDQNRQALDNGSSDDAHALAVWALAESVAHGFHTDKAQSMLDQTAVNGLIKRGYLRTLAYLLLAYCLLKDRQKADELAAKLTARFDSHLGWFEGRLTYANAAMPLSLVRYKRCFKIQDARLDKIIRSSIETLEEYNRIGIIPAPVGNRSWQKIGAVERDIYGQQAIDAGFMVLLLTEAYLADGQESYLRQATEWMDWFYGNNIYKTSLISADHACADGLNVPSRGVDTNKGAESVIMYLMSLQAYNQAKGNRRRDDEQ